MEQLDKLSIRKGEPAAQLFPSGMTEEQARALLLPGLESASSQAQDAAVSGLLHCPILSASEETTGVLAGPLLRVLTEYVRTVKVPWHYPLVAEAADYLARIISKHVSLPSSACSFPAGPAALPRPGQHNAALLPACRTGQLLRCWWTGAPARS